MKKNIDYGFKAMVMTLEYEGKLLVDWLRKIHLSLNFPDNCFSMSKKVALNMYRDIEENFSSEIISECARINSAFYNRTKRLKERVKSMVTSGDCLFLTLTFTDVFLNSTSFAYRRKAIQRFLKQFNVRSVANIDFGKKDEYIDSEGNLRKGTHREHYHALVQMDFINPKLYHYGNLDFERVRNTTDSVKLAKYISKLTNHAIKETTKRNAIMYSKGNW